MDLSVHGYGCGFAQVRVGTAVVPYNMSRIGVKILFHLSTPPSLLLGGPTTIPSLNPLLIHFYHSDYERSQMLHKCSHPAGSFCKSHFFFCHLQSLRVTKPLCVLRCVPLCLSGVFHPWILFSHWSADIRGVSGMRLLGIKLLWTSHESSCMKTSLYWLGKMPMSAVIRL